MRKQILDPLSTLCKVALLSFHENGSKLSISDNVIDIHKPDRSQWFTRRYRGDTKENISLLHNPINKAIQWYVFHRTSVSNAVIATSAESTTSASSEDQIGTSSEDTMEINDLPSQAGSSNSIDEGKITETELDSIKTIMKFTIKGLRKLKETYRDDAGNVLLALQFLINNLKIAAKDTPRADLFEEYNESIEEDSVTNSDKIKEIWNIDTIKSISSQFLLCDKNKSDPIALECTLESLTNLLKNTDTKFKKLVSDMNSSL